MNSRGKRHHLAAWLGLLALAVQAALPLLLAVEIRAAAAAGILLSSDRGAVPICHAGATPQSDGDGGPASGHHDMAACPICAALAASLACTVAAAPALLPPRGFAAALRIPAAASAPAGGFTLSYRSRAPPELG